MTQARQHADQLLQDGTRAAERGDWEIAIARADTALHLGSTDPRAPALRLRALEALSKQVLLARRADEPARSNGTGSSGPPGSHEHPAAQSAPLDDATPAQRAVVTFPRGTIEEVARRVSELAPLPMVAVEVLTLTNDDATTCDQLTKWIASDPALSTSVLRLANSAGYGRARRVETIREAVVLVGVREIGSLATMALIVDAMNNVKTINFESYWRFSLTVGLLAEMQAIATGRGREVAFAAGVLHNIGLLALDIADAAGLQLVREVEADRGLRRFEDRERHTFGFTSAELGAYLASGWGFPEPLVQAIELHHARLGELGAVDPTVEYVVTARVFARACGLSDGVESNEPRDLPKGWAGPVLISALEMAGGIEGITRRIDSLLESFTESREVA